MKKYLLPESGNFYKANIHCHTNISDGTMTPEEVKAHYMAHGYSVVAFTDHDVMLDQSDRQRLSCPKRLRSRNQRERSPFGQ